MAFNSSSIGWNAQPPEPPQPLESRQPVQVGEPLPVLIVWGESVAWIDELISRMNSWSTVVSFVLIFSLVWFVHQVHLNRRKNNSMNGARDEATGKYRETSINIHQFPKMEGVH